MTNLLIEHAASKGRDYITPEDVADVLASAPDRQDAMRVVVGQDLLRILGRIDRAGVEDPGLCAFVAVNEDWNLAPPEPGSTSFDPPRWQVVVGGHRCWKDGTMLNVVGRNIDEAAGEAAKVVRAKGHQAVAFRLTVIDDRTVEGQPLGHEFEVKAHNGGSSVVATLKATRTFVLEPDPTPEPKRDPNLAETTVNPAVEDNGDEP